MNWKRAWELVCEEPYRLFFPIGIAMGLYGVAHWLLYAVKILPSYSGSLHAGLQIELYLSAFVVGFLATAVPRFSATFPARSVEVMLFLLFLGGIFLFLSLDRQPIAHLFFVGLLVSLLFFAVRRFRKRNVQHPPVEFVWIPASMILGITGALLTVLTQIGCIPATFIHWGKPALNQGYMLALVIGVGGFLGPRAMGSRDFPNPQAIRESIASYRTRQVCVHGLCALLFIVSFILEGLGFLAASYFTRAAVSTFILLWNHALVFRPKTPGIFSRLVSVSFWMIVTGLWGAFFFPKLLVECLHFVFIGGFSLITFAIATMVVLSHSGEGERLHRSPWILKLVGVLVPLALVLRVTASFIPEYFFVFLGVSSVLWLASATAWFFYCLPFFLRRPSATAFEEFHERKKQETRHTC